MQALEKASDDSREEVDQLRRRVADLEAEVLRLKCDKHAVAGEQRPSHRGPNGTEGKRAEALLTNEAQVLLQIIEDVPLPTILETLVVAAERLTEGMIGSILLLDDDGRTLRHGAAPSLPDDYNRLVDGLQIGDGVGSCGTAAYRKASVVVSDIATDPLWAPYRPIAERFGLRACWSTPILSRSSRVLGTFAQYYRAVRSPTAAEKALIERATHLATIAIERTRARETLRRTAEHLEEAQCIAHVGYWERNLEMDRITWSDETCRIFGIWPQQEALTLACLQDLVHPEDRALMTGAIAQALQGGPRYDVEYRALRPNGEVRFVHSQGDVTRDRSGRPLRMFGTVQDVTERRQAEEEVRRLNVELEERVRQRTGQLEVANKELEAFSYSVSHDLRAPLRAISGFCDILQRRYAAPLPAEALRYLGRVQANVQQMGQLIDDLLAFSRFSRQPLRKQAVAPADLIRRALDELRAEKDGRAVQFQVGALPLCQGDPALLQLVFTNLIGNALKYSRTRAPAVIEIGCRGDRPDEIVYFVKDNGVGFDMRYADKLFGVFQRLHRAEDYEGTGVGLAIVQRVVHRHGGRIWAEAAVDRGATFFFTLTGPAGRGEEGR